MAKMARTTNLTKFNILHFLDISLSEGNILLPMAVLLHLSLQALEGLPKLNSIVTSCDPIRSRKLIEKY